MFKYCHCRVVCLDLNSIITSIKKSRPFLGNVLEVKRAPPSDRILVTNLKPNIGDILVLYFEQTKYNPNNLDDPIDIDKRGSSAVVRFKEPSSKLF